MTEPLQTSSACHSNGTSAVGTQMNVHVLSTSQKQSLDVLRFTRGCGGCDVLLHVTIEQLLTVYGHQH